MWTTPAEDDQLSFERLNESTPYLSIVADNVHPFTATIYHLIMDHSTSAGQKGFFSSFLLILLKLNFVFGLHQNLLHPGNSHILAF